MFFSLFFPPQFAGILFHNSINTIQERERKKHGFRFDSHECVLYTISEYFLCFFIWFMEMSRAKKKIDLILSMLHTSVRGHIRRRSKKEDESLANDYKSMS